MRGWPRLLLVGVCAHAACSTTSSVEVEIRSEPTGCLVYVDGEPWGTTPCVVYLRHGRHVYPCPTRDSRVVSGGLSELPWALFRWFCTSAQPTCEPAGPASDGRWVELRCELASRAEAKRPTRSVWINTADPPPGPITIALDATEPACQLKASPAAP